MVHQEDITIVNIYVPKIGPPEYLKQILTELNIEIDSNTIIGGNFNIPLWALARSFRWKIRKEQNSPRDQMDL